MDTVILNNGVEMPMIGIGTSMLDEEACERTVREALELGYRFVDTAQSYRNDTIDGHIADLIRRGALEADRFVPEDKIRAITRCLNEHPGEKFALIQENLGSDYSYSEIRFVHSALERGE